MSVVEGYYWLDRVILLAIFLLKYVLKECRYLCSNGGNCVVFALEDIIIRSNLWLVSEACYNEWIL
jgi:hypothetical protein